MQLCWNVLKFSQFILLYLRLIKTFYTMAEFNQIKVVLVKKKRTGKWLAEQIGKSNCTVSKWCSNAAQPDIPTLSKIAEVLEVDIRDLLVGNEG